MGSRAMRPKTMLATGLAMGRGVAMQALISFAAVLILWQAAATGLALPSFLLPSPADVVAAGSLLAPMPGSVVSVAVQVGDTLIDAGSNAAAPISC